MMERVLSLNHFLSLRIAVLEVLMSCTFVFAQEKPFASVSLPAPVEAAYVDRPGDLYLRLASGSIIKYDINGKLLQAFKPAEEITLFDPRDGARAFMYSKKGNWYSYSLFGSIKKTQLKEEFAIEPVWVCSSGDLNIWVFDQSDKSLKKINSVRNTVEVEVSLPDTVLHENSSILYMREYQNFLFVHIRHSGIHIFSPMGKHLKSIEGAIPYFNFLGEELYYPKDGKLTFYNLFDAEIREMTMGPGVLFLLLTDVRIYKIYADRVEFLTVGF